MGFNSGFKELNTAQHVSGIFMSIIRSLSIAVTVSSLPLERGGSSVVGRGRSDWTDHDLQHCYHHVPKVNQRRLLQLISSWWWAWGCPKHVGLYLKRRAIKLRDWCVWLVDLFEYMMMHEHTNPKKLDKFIQFLTQSKVYKAIYVISHC